MSEPQEIETPEDTSAAESRITALVAEYEKDRAGGAQAESQPQGEAKPESEAGAQPQMEEVSPQDAVLGTIQLAGAAAEFFGYKATGSVLQDARWSAVADKLVPVLNKTAWGRRILAFLQADFGFDEMQLFFAIAPLLGVLKTAFVNDVSELRKAAAEKAEQAKAEA